MRIKIEVIPKKIYNMKKLKIQNALEVKNMNFDVEGILQIAKNFIDLSKVYLKKMEFSGTNIEPEYFTFRGLPAGFAVCLIIAIDMYNNLLDNGVKIVDVERDFTVKL